MVMVRSIPPSGREDHMMVCHTIVVSGAASFHGCQERKEMVRCSRG
jgi:hypothetical protein